MINHQPPQQQLFVLNSGQNLICPQGPQFINMGTTEMVRMYREPEPAPVERRYRPILPNYPRPNYEFSITVAPGYEELLNTNQANPVNQAVVEETVPAVPTEILPVTTVEPPTPGPKPEINTETKPIVPSPESNPVPKPVPPNPETISNDPETEKPLENHQTPPKSAPNQRLTMSTPRSNRSHIRALDFSTPFPTDVPSRKAATSPKLKTYEQSTGSVGNATRNLFTEQTMLLEPITESTPIIFEEAATPPRTSDVSKVPIATRTPVVKPKENWDNVNLMFEGGQKSPEMVNLKQELTEKPSVPSSKKKAEGNLKNFSSKFEPFYN